MSFVPWMVFTALPPTRPGVARSAASFSSARAIRGLIAGDSFLKARTAAGDSSTSN
jgi:hypothetical protein